MKGEKRKKLIENSFELTAANRVLFRIEESTLHNVTKTASYSVAREISRQTRSKACSHTELKPARLEDV